MSYKIVFSGNKKEIDSKFEAFSRAFLKAQDDWAVQQLLQEEDKKRHQEKLKKTKLENKKLLDSLKQHEENVQKNFQDEKEQRERAKNINWLKRNQRC